MLSKKSYFARHGAMGIPATQEAKVGGLQVQSHPGLLGEILSQKR